MPEKYPNQRTHFCGILISEEPITNYTIEMPPKEAFPIVLFMHIADITVLKNLDILGQRGICHIDDSETVKKKKSELKPTFEEE
jgi:DNA polymerase-3 subunit alpha/error-prone DNA polymerase